MRSPNFWKDDNLISAVLSPAAGIYKILSKRKYAKITPQKVEVPVICIGNLVAGGAGKTPVALAIGNILKSLGKNVHYISRGYKGSNSGVLRVNPTEHNADLVGDEPLLLAEILPTWVAKDRVAAANAAIAAGAEMLIMDDGFQNPSLIKDVSILVIDGEYGLGNKKTLPAGPLREDVASGIARANAVIIIGEDKHGINALIPAEKKIIQAKMQPLPSAYILKDKDVIAFAGIARPRKFYRTLHEIGCFVKEMVSFPDHHKFSDKDIKELKSKALEFNSQLVTTSKDYVRLPLEIRKQVMPVAIEIVFADNAELLKIILD